MKSLPYIGFILAILGTSLGFAQDNDNDSPSQSQPPLRPSSQIIRRQPTNTILDALRSSLIINERHRVTVPVRDGFGFRSIDVPEGVSSARFTSFNNDRCFFYSRYGVGFSDERPVQQFVTPVLPSLEVPGPTLIREFRSLPPRLTQLQLPRDQTPFRAERVICYTPPDHPYKIPLLQSEVIILVDYMDMNESGPDFMGTNLRDANAPDPPDNGPGDGETFFGRLGRLGRMLLSNPDPKSRKANVRRAAIITSPDLQGTRCFFGVDGEVQRQQPFTWQSPLLTPVFGANEIVCEVGE